MCAKASEKLVLEVAGHEVAISYRRGRRCRCQSGSVHIVSRGDLAGAGMASADFSVCSYMSGDRFALEEDCDMPRFLKRLEERGIPYRLREQHTNRDTCVRHWSANPGPATAAG